MMKKQDVINYMQSAWEDCEEEGRSTEYTIQYIRDMSGFSFDTVMNFIKNKEK